MATLIICPVCDTRYETQAVFPPEGRKVRCSKCSHVWQAKPVTLEPAVPEPAPQAAAPVVAPAPPAPPPRPQPAPQTVNTAMRGFAGIPQAKPAEIPVTEVPEVKPAASAADADFDGGDGLAAQVAEINAEAMAEEAPPAEKRGGGIFSRLSRKKAAPPAAPVLPPEMAPPLPREMAAEVPPEMAPPAHPADLDAAMAAATNGAAAENVDLAGVFAGEEKPKPRTGRIVTIGWVVLILIVLLVGALFALAPKVVTSYLPGAARLYAMLGMPVGAQGLAFEDVRYDWTNDGSQTVLEVQGNVVNVSNSAVEVPTVVIALRDEKGEEISEWTTEVGETELGAGEQAAFLRQIPSPPSNVRSLKVRFAKAE